MFPIFAGGLGAIVSLLPSEIKEDNHKLLRIKISDLPYGHRVSSIKDCDKNERDGELFQKEYMIDGKDITKLIPFIRERLAEEVVIEESDTCISKAWMIPEEGHDEILVISRCFESPGYMSTNATFVYRMTLEDYNIDQKIKNKRFSLFSLGMLVGGLVLTAYAGKR